MGNFLVKFIVVSFVFLFFACSTESTKRITYHTLTPRSFTDELIVEGTVEAENVASVVCPPWVDGTVKFVVEDGTPVRKGDTVCIVEARQIDDHYESLINKLEQSKAQYNKGKADLEMNYAMLMAQVKNNEAQTAIANLDSLQLKYMPQYQRKIQELKLQIAAIEKEKFSQKLKYLELINESELKKLELQISQDEQEVLRVKEILNSLVMLAPRDGMALRSRLAYSREKVMEGDEVWEGIQIVEIPDLTEVNVKILATETEYKRIAENNKVEFVFDAMPGNKAWGSIVKKASTGQPIRRNSKIRYFEITASVDSFITLPEIGLSAKCKVTLRHIPDTLVVPQLAIFDDDSVKVVYVKKGKDFEKRQVILGEYSPQLAIVTMGLDGDETVSFAKPKASKVKWNINLSDSILQKHRLTFRQTEYNEIQSDYGGSMIEEEENYQIIIIN
ncbi:MAG TPA: efflux RND transporter periplasmic adaptor subunit [Prolixibacteraceae bacterium]|nr:efflux RND transporter periplasmic adaptor subunit [Prolixibacteraceae bacterium]